MNIDLKSALGKKRRDGKTAPLQPLTAMQRVYVGRLIEKYGNNFEVNLFLAIKDRSHEASASFVGQQIV